MTTETTPQPPAHHAVACSVLAQFDGIEPPFTEQQRDALRFVTAHALTAIAETMQAPAPVEVAP